MLKFDLITQNDEYTFDENKNTKNELNEIQKIFQNFESSFLTNLKEILITDINLDSQFLTDTLNLISEFQLIEAKNTLLKLLKVSNDSVSCEIITCLKSLNCLDELNQDEVINKIADNNIKAIVKSCF